MDEPTAYLDIAHQLSVYRTARRLAAEGRAVVLVCHDVDQALRTAHHVAVFAQGRLLAQGTPNEIYAAQALPQAFGVPLHRLQDGTQWRYYFE
jgi:iron complex transport system ATP-binding protein